MPAYALPRPKSVTAVIATHIAFGIMFLFFALFDLGVFTLIPAAITFGIAAALSKRPGSASRIAATVYAGIWAMTLIAIPVSAAIIYALWNDKANHYFTVAQARCEQDALYGP